MQLLPFLRDKNPQVRQIALSNLLPQTPKESPHRAIFFTGLQGGGLQKSKENEVIRDLKLLCRDQLVRRPYQVTSSDITLICRKGRSSRRVPGSRQLIRLTSPRSSTIRAVVSQLPGFIHTSTLL